MKQITQQIIDETCQKAQASERLRMNYNIHEEMDEPIHKMVMALEPGTELPIHRHLHPKKKETFILLQGAMEVLIYNDNKTIKEHVLMNTVNAARIVEIMPEDWHTLNILETNTVFVEVKVGPYLPFPEIDLMK